MNKVTPGNGEQCKHFNAESSERGDVVVGQDDRHWLCVGIAHPAVNDNFKRWIDVSGNNTTGSVFGRLMPKGYKFTVEVA